MTTSPPGQPWPGQQPQQPPYGQPQYPPPKKRKVWPWVVLGLVVLMLGGCFAVIGTAGKKVSDAVDAASTSIQSAANNPGIELGHSGKAKTVLYEVISPSGSALNITYFGSDNSQQQETQATLPWSKEVANDSTFAIMGITAQNGGTGEITCRITVDGKVKTEQTSKGQYAVVSCTATA